MQGKEIDGTNVGTRKVEILIDIEVNYATMYLYLSTYGSYGFKISA